MDPEGCYPCVKRLFYVSLMAPAQLITHHSSLVHKKKSRLLCKEGWWLLLSSGQGNIYFLLWDCAVFNACCFGSFKQMEIKAPIHHFNVSGKYRDGDENRLEKPPFAVCRDFAAAVEQICTMLWHCLVKCGSTAFSSQQSLPAFVFQPTVKLLLFFPLFGPQRGFHDMCLLILSLFIKC